MTFLSAFFAAVEYGHVRIAESFFSKGLKLQQLKRDLYRPLTLAAKSGSLTMVELMIQEDCDIRARDENGWNALHFASFHGHYQVIEKLIASGVSTKTTTSRRETPLILAVKGTHFAVVERLLRSDAGSSLVTTEDDRGQQPIHHATRTISLEIFNLLLSNGAKVNVENSFGWHPLHIATAYGHLGLVEMLLQQGADIEAKLGSTSIKKDQTHKIIEDGYSAEARWPYPASRALHLACEYRQDEIATFLISKGAKRESSCSEGWQPIHHATYFGSSMLVDTLLQGGVNPHAQTNEGKTASMLGFCTAGAPIPQEETERIGTLLGEAMKRVKKQKNFKVALKKASTADDKSNLLRAATFSVMMVTRPQLHKATTTAQVPGLSSTSPGSTSSEQRPRLSHLPYTSPLPSKEWPSNAAQHRSSISSLSIPQAQAGPPTLSDSFDRSRKSTDTAATETSSNVAASISPAKPPPESDLPDTADVNQQASVDTQPSSEPKPLLKRRTTFGLTRAKPAPDVTKSKPALDVVPKLNTINGIGKSTFEIGKSTLEISNKTFELGKQGFEISKQGLGKSRQNLESSGKKGVEAIKGLEVGGTYFPISCTLLAIFHVFVGAMRTVMIAVSSQKRTCGSALTQSGNANVRIINR